MIGSAAWHAMMRRASRGCRRSLCAAALLAVSTAVRLPAQPPEVPRPPAHVRQRLAQVDALIDSKQWEEAVQLVRELLANASRSVVPADPKGPSARRGFIRYEPLRHAIARRLASWRTRAPEALAVYREQVDPTVDEWLAGTTSDQLDVARRVRDEVPLATRAPELLMALGERCLRGGSVLRAMESWQLLDPASRLPTGQPIRYAAPWIESARLPAAIERLEQLAPFDRHWLCVTSTGETRVAREARARYVAALLLLRPKPEARYMIELLRRAPPTGEGRLLGRSGPWIELIESLQADAERWPTRWDRSWSTWAGRFERMVQLPDMAVEDHPAWVVRLPRFETAPRRHHGMWDPVGERWGHRMPYFVAASGETVVWAQPNGWHAASLATGRPIVTAEADRSNPGRRRRIFETQADEFQWFQRMGRRVDVPEFSVTIHDGLVLGVIHRLQFEEGDAVPGQWRSELVAVELSTQRLRQRIVAEAPWRFGAPPVVRDGTWYIVATRREGGQTRSEVWAYDASTGDRRWRTLIGRARDRRSKQAWPGDRLTLSEDLLFVQTHSGLVASLNARDGTYRWICRYPQDRMDDQDGLDMPARNMGRRGTPPLLVGDMLFVAPADSGRLLAYDAIGGSLLWSTGQNRVRDVRHLLGVIDGTLIASGDRLYWIDVLTGDVVFAFPELGGGAGEGLPRPRGLGRGLIAGGTIYWPVDDRIFRIDARRRIMAQPPLLLRPWGMIGGNLHWHRGFLLMATSQSLSAWPAPAVSGPNRAPPTPAHRQ